MRKSQSAMEFVILASFMLLVFVGIFSLVGARMLEIQEAKSYQLLEDNAESVNKEIKIARSALDGYTRTFLVPLSLDGYPYNISLVADRELVSSFEGYEYVLFLPDDIEGNLSTGLNKIEKKDGTVFITSLG